MGVHWSGHILCYPGVSNTFIFIADEICKGSLFQCNGNFSTLIRPTQIKPNVLKQHLKELTVPVVSRLQII